MSSTVYAPHPNRVVAACDFSPSSTRALRRAASIASAARGELHVVHVEPSRPLGGAGAPEVTPATMDRLRVIVDAALPLRNELAKVTLHGLLGSAATEIAWLAAHVDADLVVVGTRGRRGMSRIVLGSTAEKITRLCGCAVLVERGKQHDTSAREPEVEPLCPRCAKHRAETGGSELWCSEHASHHLRMHLTAGGGRGGGTSPWSVSG